MKFEMSKDLQRKMRNEYCRNWRKQNPEKVQKINENFWRKKYEEKLRKENEECQ